MKNKASEKLQVWPTENTVKTGHVKAPTARAAKCSTPWVQTGGVFLVRRTSVHLGQLLDLPMNFQWLWELLQPRGLNCQPGRPHLLVHIQELASLGNHTNTVQYALCSASFKKFYFEWNEIPMITLGNLFKLLHYEKKRNWRLSFTALVWAGFSFCFKETPPLLVLSTAHAAHHDHPTLCWTPTRATLFT